MRGAIILAAGVVGLSGCLSYGATGPLEHERHQIALDKAASTRVELGMRAGELEVLGGAASLLEGDFAYNVPEWKPSLTHDADGPQSEIAVVQGDGPTVFGDTENTWRVALNDSRPLDLNARLGAGEARLKL